MPTILLQILLAVLIVSMVSFVGTFIFVSKKLVGKFLFYAVSFAAGTLLGAAFLDLLPEALTSGFNKSLPLFILLGILSFFILEKFLYWHHHHTGRREVHAFTYLNTVGDGLHNFMDGAVIAISFLNSPSLGIIVTIAVIAHEIPQEIGDFAVLMYGGWSRAKASLVNFLTALTAFLGALAAYFYSSIVQNSGAYLTAYAAGGFIYIASTDLIPEIQKEKDLKKSLMQFTLMVFGILLIYTVGNIFE
ncbi:ZIP family metal transporter [Candidatus Woesearchaeota archaeon]|nr:ZIP family metal transporter [Candidatus Woesearchaeota archaeon]